METTTPSPHGQRSSLRARFVLAISIVLTPLLVLAPVSYFSFQKVVASFRTVAADATHHMHGAVVLENALLRAAMPANDYLIHGNTAERVKFAGLRREVDKAFAELERDTSLNTTQVTHVRHAVALWKSAEGIADALLATTDPVGNATAAALMEQMDARLDEAAHHVANVHHEAMTQIAEQTADAQNASQHALIVAASIFVLGVIISAVTALRLYRAVLTPVWRLENGVARLAAGDLSWRIKAVGDAEFAHLACAFNSMAANLEQARHALVDLSVRDALTGALNRRELERLLNTEIARANRYQRSFCLLIIDFDHFKLINDTYGHPAGDAVLRSVARLLQKSIRPSDHFARYGGEEFVILLPETAAAGMVQAAERIRALVANHPIEISEMQTVAVSVSVGVSAFPQHGTSPEALIAAADKALYAAKRSGRNRVCVAAQDPVSP
jgi:diguanylate cyclase (GGDEF)-like protein